MEEAKEQREVQDQQKETSQSETPQGESRISLEEVLAKLSEGLSRLEAKLEGGGTKSMSSDLTPEALLAELEREKTAAGASPSTSQVDWDALASDPQAFAQFLMAQVQETYVSPILERLELLRVREEIRECKAKYPDFDEYREQVFQIGVKNPYLTLEEAYQLAKAGRGSVRAEKPGAPPVAPQKQKVPPPTGMKPGVSRTGMEEGAKSVREAAAKALEELGLTS